MEECTYHISFPELGIDSVRYAWASGVDAALAGQVIELMRETTLDAPIIGFGTAIADQEAQAYLTELRGNLQAGKCKLLTIYANTGDLIGLCTLRRNLNPNNRHITDLAKGMIAKRCRGGDVLAAAFHEICLECERDGVELLTLDVRAGTRAHAVWTSCGFTTYGILPDYARVNGDRIAGHFMMQEVAALKARVGQMAEKKLLPEVR